MKYKLLSFRLAHDLWVSALSEGCWQIPSMWPAAVRLCKRNPLSRIKSQVSPFGLQTRASSATVVPKVAVVGAGPAGFYAVQHLVKAVPGIQVGLC